jgi:hypothetical protein
MPLIMRSSATFSRLTGSFGVIRFFSEGTWSARGRRCPTAASGSNCWSEFIDGGAAGFHEGAVCAIATELSTTTSNAIVVINFCNDGSPSWGPLKEDGELRERNCLPLTTARRHTAAWVSSMGQSCPSGRREHCGGFMVLVMPVEGKARGRLSTWMRSDRSAAAATPASFALLQHVRCVMIVAGNLITRMERGVACHRQLVGPSVGMHGRLPS